ncbi:MAG: quinone-dependent dihydroorotate dehydrogenase [Patescibacteria group bacterium]
MSVIYDKILKPVFFLMDPEFIHHRINSFGYWLGRFGATRSIVRFFCKPYADPVLQTQIAGIKLQNPLGVGAGFDKEGRIVHTLNEVGFGYVEVGSITGQLSPGNPRPRLWRLPEDRALVVNYGLLSTGADAVKNRFAAIAKDRPWPIPVGISVAKSNVPGLSGEAGMQDLLDAYAKLEPFASYMTVNVSCPNVGDANQYCQDPLLYRELLSRLDAIHPSKPVFFKLSPDLSDERVLEILKDTEKYSWAKGFVLTNLTHDRTGLTSKNLAKATKGGVSGQHLKMKADHMLAVAAKAGRPRFEFIGLGGIETAEDAYRKIKLGASVVQIVTSVIYNGPTFPSTLLRHLAELIKKDGYTSIAQAVGKDL